MENTGFISSAATGILSHSHHERHRPDQRPAHRLQGRSAPRGCMVLRVVLHCPRCGSRSIRISGRQNRMDRLLALFRLYRHRCELCRSRFYLPLVAARLRTDTSEKV